MAQRKSKNRRKKSAWNYIKSESDPRKIKWKVLIVCFAILFIVAFAGSMFTDTGSWYESVKPSITPPNWVFPVAWTVLFYLISVSLYYSWLGKKEKLSVIILYGINFILNILWSVLYFGMKQPLLAFIDIIALWISILILIIYNWKRDRKASYFLIPYLLWVSFASILNYLTIGK